MSRELDSALCPESGDCFARRPSGYETVVQLDRKDDDDIAVAVMIVLLCVARIVEPDCDAQIRSSAGANLLDDGIVDTLVSTCAA